jgi:hypothetical protein
MEAMKKEAASEEEPITHASPYVEAQCL